jgi:hypothetical protein
MDVSRFDSPEDRQCIGASEHGSFNRGNHQHLSAASFAPGDEASLAAAKRHSLSGLDRDDCCFFLASHSSRSNLWVVVFAFAKIPRDTIP